MEWVLNDCLVRTKQFVGCRKKKFKRIGNFELSTNIITLCRRKDALILTFDYFKKTNL